MRTFALTLFAGATLAAPAFALDTPRAGALDRRIRQIAYTDRNIINITAAVGDTLTIELSPQEHIADVAASDTANLQYVRGNRSSTGVGDNVIYLKPKAEMRPQPIFIKTTRADGSTRLYNFQFQTRGNAAAGDGDSYFLLRFFYPADAAAERAAKWREQRTRARAREAEVALRAAPAPAEPNWRYVAQGDSAMSPASVWDDGQSTYFYFVGNQRIPAIFTVLPDRHEAAVNYSVDGGLVTVHQTAADFLLRDGDTVLHLVNRAYTPQGVNPGTGTTSPGVTRVVKEAAQ